MSCRRKNTLCLSLDFGANDGTLLPRLTRLETSPSPQKRLVLKFPNITVAAAVVENNRIVVVVVVAVVKNNRIVAAVVV